MPFWLDSLRLPRSTESAAGACLLRHLSLGLERAEWQARVGGVVVVSDRPTGFGYKLSKEYVDLFIAIWITLQQ